jgi:hypothetical protein
MKLKQKMARIIQASIREILVKHWNPMGFPVHKDEYDSCIAPVYRLLLTKPSAEQIIALFQKMAEDFLGLPIKNDEKLQRVVEELQRLNVHLDSGPTC